MYWQLLQLQLVALATLAATAAGAAGQGRPQPTLVHDPMVSTAAPLYLDGAGSPRLCRLRCFFLFRINDRNARHLSRLHSSLHIRDVHRETLYSRTHEDIILPTVCVSPTPTGTSGSTQIRYIVRIPSDHCFSNEAWTPRRNEIPPNRNCNPRSADWTVAHITNASTGTTGPAEPLSASRSVRRALLTPQVNPGSRSRWGREHV